MAGGNIGDVYSSNGRYFFYYCKKFSITLDALIAANPQIENPGLILSGQVINIPNQGQVQALASSPHGGRKNTEPGILGEKPLHVVDITWDGKGTKGLTVIPKKPTLTVEFNKNVVSDAVWENNRKSISRNKKTPIYVTRIKDNVDFSMRNKIFIQPVNFLTPGTVYTLKISPNFKSKAGVTLAGNIDGYGYSIDLRTES
ncbi:MAG: Ig-like domain-containing protein [Desulfotomaculaceae bacterium]|nr:Ig-like domain-containing protein [Desulfotomaculaceae bacterium]